MRIGLNRPIKTSWHFLVGQTVYQNHKSRIRTWTTQCDVLYLSKRAHEWVCTTFLKHGVQFDVQLRWGEIESMLCNSFILPINIPNMTVDCASHNQTSFM